MPRVGCFGRSSWRGNNPCPWIPEHRVGTGVCCGGLEELDKWKSARVEAKWGQSPARICWTKSALACDPSKVVSLRPVAGLTLDKPRGRRIKPWGVKKQAWCGQGVGDSTPVTECLEGGLKQRQIRRAAAVGLGSTSEQRPIDRG